MENWTLIGKRVIVLATLITLVAGSNEATAQSKKGIRSFKDVKKVVEKHFASQDGYSRGDLINSQHVGALFDRLARSGWKVAERDALLARVVPAGSFLDKELNSKTGKSYFHKISKVPGGIDQLDRMSRLPYGKKSVHNMIHKIPNGSDWIKAVSSTPRGKQMGSSAPERIYTVDVLMKELQVSFAKHQRKLASKKKRRKSNGL